MTLEAFPSENNYRNLGDVFTRPTIEQLIEGKTNEVKDAEKGDDEDKATFLTMLTKIQSDDQAVNKRTSLAIF